MLGRVGGADLLTVKLPPTVEKLSGGPVNSPRSALMTQIRNPLALRFPLLDPDAFLAATLPLIRPLFTTAGLIGWIALVTTGIAMGAMNIGALTGNLDDQLLTTQNVALMLLAYPLVKAFHELGHAYATSVWGV